MVKNETYYDIKAGNRIFYGKNLDEIEKVLKEYQEIMMKKNCGLIIETPGTVPTSEIKEMEIFLQNKRF